jgi:hypothetical protein
MEATLENEGVIVPPNEKVSIQGLKKHENLRKCDTAKGTQ